MLVENVSALGPLEYVQSAEAIPERQKKNAGAAYRILLNVWLSLVDLQVAMMRNFQKTTECVAFGARCKTSS